MLDVLPLKEYKLLVSAIVVLKSINLTVLLGNCDHVCIRSLLGIVLIKLDISKPCNHSHMLNMLPEYVTESTAKITTVKAKYTLLSKYTEFLLLPGRQK